jgi:hypothetical protein
MTYRYRKWNDSEEIADCYSNSHTHFFYWCSFACPFPILRSLGPHTIITNLDVFLCPVPSSSWLVDGCVPPPVDVFSHTRKAKNPYALLKKKSWTCKTPGRSVFGTEFRCSPEQSYLKPGPFRKKLGRMVSLLIVSAYRKRTDKWTSILTRLTFKNRASYI